MYVHKLTLEKFRGAGNLSIELDKRLNLFVGINGAGKSSVLDAVAILLSWLVNRIKHANASGRPITEADIKNREPSASIGITVIDKERSFSWNLVKVRKGHSRKEGASVLADASELARQFQTNISANDEDVSLPLFAYYPVNRAVLDIPLRIREKHRFDLMGAYDESLTSGANFRTFFEWFRQREDLENEQRRYLDSLIKPDDFIFPDPQLEAVRRALSSFMPDFKNLTVRRNPLRMEIEKHKQTLTVNQLSDGEKCLMAMVGDIARRMAIANPGRSNPLKGEGVILIDEIDLHLHPKWQRMVTQKLLEVFPGCQFLISTHSPHVITHVQPDSVFLLSMTDTGLESVQPTESYGKTVERVLEDLMGLETTRPVEVEKEIQDIYEQIDQGNFDKAKQLIVKLTSQIGGDSELVKATVLIKRKEMIGK
jgi:predicted ATP-binding protein involved in virulence